MRQFIKITDAADDLALLSIEELRAAVGVTGGAQDADLTALGLRIAAAIAAECHIAAGAGGSPTLLQETIEETIFGASGSCLFLSRRHEVEVLSLTVDGAALDVETDIFVDPEAGLVTRLAGGMPGRWHASKVVVTYKAGFETAPGDLKMAALDFVRLAWAERDRDPALKSERTEIVGVEVKQRDYWVGSVPGQQTESAVPDVVAGQLQRFRNSVLA